MYFAVCDKTKLDGYRGSLDHGIPKHFKNQTQTQTIIILWL